MCLPVRLRLLLVAVVAALVGLLLPSSVAASTSTEPGLPWLATSGNRLVVAETGEDVVLRGANVLRSEWDWRMDAERTGIPALAQQWGGNVIVRGFASDPVNAVDARYLTMLDEHVSLAAREGMYVVFAWRSHTVNGPQPTMPDDRAQRALAALAARYHGVSHVMYALQVEPHDVTWAELQPRFTAMVDAIRAAASPYKPIVMVPGTKWSRDVSGAISLPVQRDNLVYKTHPYNSQALFDQQFVTLHQSGKPVFIGEFGYLPDHNMHMADVSALLDLADRLRLGWAAWAFDFQGGPALVTDNTSWQGTIPYGQAVQQRMLATDPVPTSPSPALSPLPVSSEPLPVSSEPLPVTSGPLPVPAPQPTPASPAPETDTPQVEEAVEIIDCPQSPGPRWARTVLCAKPAKFTRKH